VARPSFSSVLTVASLPPSMTAWSKLKPTAFSVMADVSTWTSRVIATFARKVSVSALGSSASS
jgi:hypothetical protein